MRSHMPERFVMPSLSEVAKTVNESIQEAKAWKTNSNSKSKSKSKSDTKRIA